MEIEDIDKKIKEEKEFKKLIMERARIDFNSEPDYDAWIWNTSFLKKFKTKKEKKEFVKFLDGKAEGVFNKVRNAFMDWHNEEINKKYIKIDDIPSAENIFGIIKDRMKSNENMVKSCDKDLLNAKKKILKAKGLKEMEDLESKKFWAEYLGKDYRKTARMYGDLKKQITWDIKSLERKNKTATIKTTNNHNPKIISPLCARDSQQKNVEGNGDVTQIGCAPSTAPKQDVKADDGSERRASCSQNVQDTSSGGND